MTTLAIVAAGLGGAFVGWWAGLLLCPDPGDIGIGTIPWAIGGAACGAIAGAACGAIAGVAVTAAVLT